MKSLAALVLLTATFGVALCWSDLFTPKPIQTHDSVEAVRIRAIDLGQHEAPAQAPRPSRLAVLDRLPSSFAGTQVDGQLRAGAAGNLVINYETRRVFDYFLASIGEESIEASVIRLQRYIEAQLPPPAQDHALRLLGQYLDYKRQLLLLEKEHAQRPDMNAMRARLSAARQLRADIFDDVTHRAFFAQDEAADNYTLERLAVRHDPSLDAAAKGAALDRLQRNLPPGLQDTLAIQVQIELREQASALHASGGSSVALRQLRQQMVGNAAAARLEKLDAERDEWRSRVNAYRHEKALIAGSRGLSEADKRAAIDRLAADRFDEYERQRLEAAERVLTAKSG